jgi:hypothetical protein
MTYTVVASAKNDDLMLFPGMTAKANIIAGELPDALQVPGAEQSGATQARFKSTTESALAPPRHFWSTAWLVGVCRTQLSRTRFTCSGLKRRPLLVLSGRRLGNGARICRLWGAHCRRAASGGDCDATEELDVAKDEDRHGA